MVLTRRKTALAPTLVVPDEQTWTLTGADPAAAGLRPVFVLGDAQRLLVPERLPDPLLDVLAARVDELPPGFETDQRTLHDLAGRSVASVLEPVETGGHDIPAEHGSHNMQADRGGHDMHADHGGHDMRADHGGHDMHGDHGHMMAIVGEPSADGLVIEPIELRYGPLATPLPGGIAVDVTLDGDVVSDATVKALLTGSASPEGVPAIPDLLAPVAWRVAIDRAAGAPMSKADRWLRVAAVEIERAVSHLAWLRSLGRLLGWRPLVDRCTAALGVLAESHRQLSAAPIQQADVLALEPARGPVQEVLTLVAGSRWLRLRASGRAVVTAEVARERQLRGPVARASGLADDSRSRDPLYQQLGFAPLLRSGGDALARTRLRAQETAGALDLAAGALRAAAAWTPADTIATGERATVEGPRGPVETWRTHDGWRFGAPGAREALLAAGESMIGLEWAAALVALASFDLSPWRVPE